MMLPGADDEEKTVRLSPTWDDFEGCPDKVKAYRKQHGLHVEAINCHYRCETFYAPLIEIEKRRTVISHMEAV